MWRGEVERALPGARLTSPGVAMQVLRRECRSCHSCLLGGGECRDRRRLSWANGWVGDAASSPAVAACELRTTSSVSDQLREERELRSGRRARVVRGSRRAGPLGAARPPIRLYCFMTWSALISHAAFSTCSLSEGSRLSTVTHRLSGAMHSSTAYTRRTAGAAARTGCGQPTVQEAMSPSRGSGPGIDGVGLRSSAST